MVALVIIGMLGMLATGGATFFFFLREEKKAKALQANFRSHIPAPGEEIAFRYWLQGTATEAELARAMHLALSCLAPVWHAQDIEHSLEGISVIVKASPTWEDAWGRMVAGLAMDDGSVAVGSDLAGLCHELAHVLEWKLDRAIDEGHFGWPAKGITAAIAKYQALLRARGVS